MRTMSASGLQILWVDFRNGVGVRPLPCSHFGVVCGLPAAGATAGSKPHIMRIQVAAITPHSGRSACFANFQKPTLAYSFPSG